MKEICPKCGQVVKLVDTNEGTFTNQYTYECGNPHCDIVEFTIYKDTGG